MAERDDLADHVDRSMEAIAKVHRAHAQSAGPLQRFAERATALAARPASIGCGALLAGGWMAWNVWVGRHGRHAPDPPPFAWLELAASLAGMGLAALILTTQRRANLLEDQRSQLILELALLNEQRSAKLVALLEELRRDSPQITDRVDLESEAMARPTDTEGILEEIERRAADP
jgi:uncharacterized membrane protein